MSKNEEKAQPAVRANALTGAAISNEPSPLDAAFSLEESRLCAHARGSSVTFGKKEKMSRVCPSCQEPLLSGFSPLCNLCGARLPSELLFSEAEKKRIEAEELTAQLQLEEMEAERKKKAADAAAAAIYYS